ncbi:DNA primase [Chromobacterium sphagni]|uniref:DNA primase n=1 Tax=Chromobacterium sphagni TaxID=1903179 RepID=A0A1S1X057_9NEIS|nr:DNA primase [Chromobacterium sphagni]OHX12912.1 DNA primase [Chromobacterium sphagni]OHX19883.1 DNA primase [Chromobacterium sphagni]
MIPQDFIDQLLSRVDIVDVVDRYVPLKKGGQNYMACCPFHKEKSPSFTVSPSKQFYHCFGCGAHGSAIGFVMEYQGIGFVDAVKLLAEGIGMQVPNERVVNPEASRKAREKQVSLEQLMQLANDFYRRELKSGPNAVAYCKGRGLSGEIAARFGLGYAPDGWQNLEAITDNYQDEKLVEAGLVIVAEDSGRRYDRFRDRLMFPIRNQRGAIVGFGGRVLGKGEPKYLNSPETPLFEKGRELYGLYEARQAIRDKNRVLVVEGYMDVVALAQYGVGYAVATLGTATTGEHVRKLLKHADQVYFCFDGDKAGLKAAWRALENSLPQLVDGKSLSFLFLPSEHDPDSYVREFGTDAFEQLLEQESLPLSVYFTRELCREVNLSTPEGKADLIRRAAPLLAQISAPALGFIIKKRLAELAGVEVDEFDMLTGGKPRAERSRSGRRDYKLPAESQRQINTTMVKKLIKWLLMNPGWAGDVQLPDSMALSDELACFAMLAERVQEHGEEPNTAQLIEGLRGTPYEGLIDSVLQQAMQDPDEFADPSEDDRQLFQDGNAKLLKMLHAAQLERLKLKDRHEGLTSEEKALFGQLWREMFSSPN